MWNIALSETLAKLSVVELEHELAEFMEPMSSLMPEKRLRDVQRQMVCCVLATETPFVTAMSRSVSCLDADCWAAAKRVYRFLSNQRFNYHRVYKGLYRIDHATVR